jgi:hypothetical protein
MTGRLTGNVLHPVSMHHGCEAGNSRQDGTDTHLERADAVKSGKSGFVGNLWRSKIKSAMFISHQKGVSIKTGLANMSMCKDGLSNMEKDDKAHDQVRPRIKAIWIGEYKKEGRKRKRAKIPLCRRHCNPHPRGWLSTASSAFLSLPLSLFPSLSSSLSLCLSLPHTLSSFWAQGYRHSEKGNPRVVSR